MSTREFVEDWLAKALRPGPYLTAVPCPTADVVEASLLCDAAEAGFTWDDFEGEGVDLKAAIATSLEKFNA